MLNGLARLFFKLLFFLLRWFFNLLLLPLKPLLLLFPTFNDYLTIAYDFIDDYVFKPIAFGREVFLNLTGFPQGLLSLSVNFSLLIMGTILTLKGVAFFKNVWRMLRGG